MNYDNNDMDKKLRQLENQSLPDLSQMDMQWETMKASLVAGIQPEGKPFYRKPGFYFIAAAFIGVLFFLFYTLNHRAGEVEKEITTIQPTVTTPAPVTESTVPLTDTTPERRKDSLYDGKIHLLSDSIAIIAPAVHIESKPVKVKIRSVEITPSPKKGLVDTVKVSVPATNPKMLLKAFFKELEKPAQEFAINPKLDTVIRGKEGTALFISANTFTGSDDVTIVLKEYYTYKDIITNRLTTTSNGEQLVSGGMLHIMAMSKGKEIAMQPSKSIRWFLPDTTEEIKSMRLFSGAPARTTKVLYTGGDTIASTYDYASYNDVNWIAEPTSFDRDYLTTKVKVLDIRNTPIRTRNTSKGEVGVFRLSDDPKADKEELKERLKQQYGYYKVRIKGNAPLTTDKKKRGFVITRNIRRMLTKPAADGVGDSIWIDESEARAYRLGYTDKKVAKNAHTEFLSEQGYRRLQDMVFDTTFAKKFSVEVRTLGWINCDRFMNDGRKKMFYYVDLRDTATNYYTILVFDKIKSMMPGTMSGTMVRFANVPEGETARVITVGIKNGKAIAASKTVQISDAKLDELQFEEITPAGFKEQASAMDK